MAWQDILLYIVQVLKRQRFRTAVLWLAIAIGVIAVNLLIALGEGAKSFVADEFNLLGQQTLIVLPGKTETKGGMPSFSGESPRSLTLKDAQAVSSLSSIDAVAPLVVGNIEVSYAGKLREVMVLGTNKTFFSIRQIEVSQGQLLPEMALDKARAVCIIGSKLAKELFLSKPVLGEWVRAGDSRFRVIGVLKERGTSFGLDMGDSIILPVASAQTLFNVEGLFRLFAEVKVFKPLNSVKKSIIDLLKERHEGEEDITIISQDAMLASVQNILDILTLSVAGIASISMLVAGVLIMNMMIITVSQRTKEIGLLKALGATAATIRVLFLCEAGFIALIASLSALLLSNLLLLLANSFIDVIHFQAPWWSQVTSVLLAFAFALIFAWLPAQKAASLAPVEALQGKQKRGR